MSPSAITNLDAPTRVGNDVETNGVATYYEVTGTGAPLVLLHGGMCTAETFDAQVAGLSPHYTVYVPERYGHGRTGDIDGPLTYEAQAEHTAAFMDALGIASAHLVGWSDGAMAALLVALRRPKLVRKLVLLEQFATLDLARPGYLPMMRAAGIEVVPPFLIDAHRALSPDGPDHVSVVFEKLHTTWCGSTGVELGDLGRVTAPTLVLAGDDGCMRLEAVAAMAGAFPHSQVAVVPGTSHGLPLEKPDIVNQLILGFLADEQAPKLFALDD